MSELLRQYESRECGIDGYPYVWHDQHAVDIDGSIIWGRHAGQVAKDTTADLVPAIKDLIRDQVDHRCLRCGHPYLKGEHGNGEWSPCDKQCRHPGPFALIEPEILEQSRELQGPFIPLAVEQERGAISQERALKIATDRSLVILAAWRILTVHHLDEDKANCRWWNLAALCQRCHLRMQRAVIMGRPYHYEHSEWFRPFAAGFYAWKYLSEDLTREETMERLDELLALELRFNQEVLPI